MASLKPELLVRRGLTSLSSSLSSALAPQRSGADRALSLAWRIGALAAGAYALKRLVDARRTQQLAGQVVLITGGSRGLGLLLAREFGRKGCRLAICARDGAELERARLGLEHRGYEVLASVCDVSEPA